MSHNYTLPTIKQLFAEATMCAHPDCNEPLVFHERGNATVVAEIAHIRSGSVNGPRHDGTFSGDIDGVQNLLLLCGKHHRPVDRHEAAYSVEELLDWKRNQGEAARSGGTDISNEQARQFVQLSADEERALAQIARLSERVLATAKPMVFEFNKIWATRDAELQAFVRRNPMWEVDDDGNRTRVDASQVSLAKVNEDRYTAEARAVVAEGNRSIAVSVQELREEIAILRMRSGTGLQNEMNAVVEAAERVPQDAGNLPAATDSLESAVRTLWRAAIGEI